MNGLRRRVPLADLRERLNDRLALVDAEKLEALVNSIFELKRRQNAEFACKKCGARQIASVEVQDVKGQVQALATLLDQGMGKPAETKRLQVDVNVSRAALESRSDEELLALVAEDGDWVPAGELEQGPSA